MRRSSSLLAIATGLAIAAVLGGCSVPGQSGTWAVSPSATLAHTASPRTEKIVEVEMPESIYYARSGDPIADFDSSPRVGWFVRGESIVVPSFGFADCAREPVTVTVISGGEISLTYSEITPTVVCWMEEAQRNVAISLPEDVTGRPLTVTLDFPDRESGSSANTFELD